MASEGFTAKEVVELIEACRKNGVEVLNYLGLSLKMDRPDVEVQPEKPYLGEPYTPDQDEDELAHLSEEEKNELANELRDYELLTSDPIAYEQSMIDAELAIAREEDAGYGYSET